MKLNLAYLLLIKIIYKLLFQYTKYVTATPAHMYSSVSIYGIGPPLVPVTVASTPAYSFTGINSLTDALLPLQPYP